jgi:hypothetical protein
MAEIAGKRVLGRWMGWRNCGVLIGFVSDIGSLRGLQGCAGGWRLVGS